MTANTCCLDPFTAGIKTKAPSVGALLAPAFLRDLKDIFEHIPITNVNNENRFAAMNTRSFASHGNMVCGRTLASDHVLMESKLVLEAGLASAPQPHASTTKHVFQEDMLTACRMPHSSIDPS